MAFGSTLAIRTKLIWHLRIQAAGAINARQLLYLVKTQCNRVGILWYIGQTTVRHCSALATHETRSIHVQSRFKNKRRAPPRKRRQLNPSVLKLIADYSVKLHVCSNHIILLLSWMGFDKSSIRSPDVPKVDWTMSLAVADTNRLPLSEGFPTSWATEEVLTLRNSFLKL